MKFSELNFHPAIERGINDLGFSEPTPIQRDAVPPALEGRDVLGVRHDRQRQDRSLRVADPPAMLEARGGRTRALIVTPTRELASQIHEHIQDLARHTPDELGDGLRRRQARHRKSRRSAQASTSSLLHPDACSTSCETRGPASSTSRFSSSTRPTACSTWDSCPTSADPRATAQEASDDALLGDDSAADRQAQPQSAQDPVRIDVERRSAPATGITQAILPVPEQLKTNLLQEMIARGDVETALVFTRTKHRANRLSEAGARRNRVRPHPRQPQPAAT